MSRLSHVIVFTPDVGRMRRFYQDQIGVAVSREGHGWVALRPAGAALWLHALGERHRREIAIAFHVEDLDAAATALRAHGTVVTERENDAIFGRVAYFRDPEGNLVDLHAGVSVERPAAGPAFPTVVLNCRNMAATHAFYRDVLGLAPQIESPGWMDFETGATSLALHPRPDRPDRPGREAHHQSPITIGFTGPRDAVSFARALEKRGLQFVRPPANQGFGTFAEAADPDGNVLVFRGRVEPAAEAPPAKHAAAKRTPAAKKARAAPARRKPSAGKRRAAARKRASAKKRAASRKLKR
jgi:predicted enzyme related to lactoylglutathione lyase